MERPTIDKGIPTAEQEALQKPMIDPTLLAGIGAGFGLMPMLHALAMGGLTSMLPGATPGRTAAFMIPGPNIVRMMGDMPNTLGAVGDTMYGLSKQHIGNILKGAGLGGGMSEKEIDQLADDILWNDKTSLRAVTTPGNPETSVTEQWGSMLRGLKNDTRPYIGAEVGRPLGLAALIADVRNRIGRDSK